MPSEKSTYTAKFSTHSIQSSSGGWHHEDARESKQKSHHSPGQISSHSTDNQRCTHSNLHAGPNQTLAHLRQKYWIMKGMTAVKAETKSCMKCKRINKPLCQQKMADLPDFRKNALPPFAHTGLDYAGPLLVKSRRDSTSPTEK